MVARKYNIPSRRIPEYRVWSHMRGRCGNPSDAAYSDYGGRGIKVCQSWQNDFEAFLFAIGKRPSPRHSIDRRNNEGNYSCGVCAECVANGWPMNVRWATKTEQARNRRSSVRVTIKGESHTIVEWAEISSLHPKILYARFSRGWASERLLEPSGNTRVMPPRRMVTIHRETRGLREWATAAGIDDSALAWRLREGWPEKDLLLPKGTRDRDYPSRAPRKNNFQLTLNGISLTVAEWAARTGLTTNTIHNRRRQGWPLSRVLSEPMRDYPSSTSDATELRLVEDGDGK